MNIKSSKYQVPQAPEKINIKIIKNSRIDRKTIIKNNSEKQRFDIASVIHDEICPIMTVLLHDLYLIEKISESSTVKIRANKCVDQITDALNRCRLVLLDLLPNEEGPGLTESLDYMFNKIKLVSGIATSSEIDPRINQLKVEQQSVIYRTVQEALSNVSKHSHAKHVHVSAKIVHGEVRVCVVDDGIGFGCLDLSPAFCLGLKMQSQRAKDLAGNFTIKNNSNNIGTQILLSFPLDSNSIYL